ncbi:aspartic proteinase [Athelia psychrophila]|uniref:Aspartic proteinase n=1 Tax=Athelia psychrophila TaxID=1759441 RepID=A0A166QU99_9AGAM|nr:aspartic proteinase [Fibularhizoctonia sp. CBS 109695]
MFSASLFLSLVLLVDNSIATNPSGSLAFRKHLNTNRDGKTIAHTDRARVADLSRNTYKRGKRSSAVPVTNAGVAYTASVGVGSPPTNYTLFVDSGSANTWIGHNKTYNPTSTSVATGDKISITYGDGTMNGSEYLDQITLSSSLVIANQSIGVDDRTGDFSSHGGILLDGIIGIGPVSQTAGTITTRPSNYTVPTVSNNLYAQGTIESEVVGIYYAPATSADAGAGELSFGGADSSKYTGDIGYVASESGDWYISSSMAYGNDTFLTGSGLVDTGTILIYLSEPQFSTYLQGTGGTLNTTLNLIEVTPAQYAALQPLNFLIGNHTYTLNANAQIWPRTLNAEIGGEADGIYLIVSTFGDTFPFQFIMGLTFLERFYSVFDTPNSRIGFATTAHTNDTSN